MSYDPNTPQAQPSPAATQAQIQTNFARFATIFARNHSAINSSNQGDHEAVVMQNQVTDPTVLGDFVALYNKNATSQLGTQPQLFARIRQILPLVTNSPMQLTYNTVNTTGPNQFQSFLIGGYLLYFGTVTAIGTVTLVPAPTEIVIAIAQPNNIQSSIPNTVSVNILNNSQFDILSSTATGVYSFTWIVIAKA